MASLEGLSELFVYAFSRLSTISLTPSRAAESVITFAAAERYASVL